MKRKEVDDVMGGEGAWDNVDRTDGEQPPRPIYLTSADLERSAMSDGFVRGDEGVLLHGADTQCG